MRPTLGKEPAAEEANPVGYLSGDMGIGLATFPISSPQQLSADRAAAHDYLLNLRCTAPLTCRSQPCDVGHSHFTNLMQLYANKPCAWELGMANPTEAKRRAEECRQLASLEPDEDDQAFWLRMAEEWERLANLAMRSEEKASLRQNLELGQDRPPATWQIIP